MGARRCHGSTLMFWPFSFLLTVWCRIRTIFCNRYWIILLRGCLLLVWLALHLMHFFSDLKARISQGKLDRACCVFSPGPSWHYTYKMKRLYVASACLLRFKYQQVHEASETGLCAPESLLGFQEVCLSTYCPGSTCPLETCKDTYSSVLAWRIPGTGKPGGLLSIESHRVGHD